MLQHKTIMLLSHPSNIIKTDSKLSLKKLLNIFEHFLSTLLQLLFRHEFVELSITKIEALKISVKINRAH